jgi:murein L,D-transpeptidase YcbB/YkuD
MNNKQLTIKIKSVTRQGSHEDQLEAIEKILNEHRPEQLHKKPDVGRTFTWNTNDLPIAEDINAECATYYLVKVRGYANPTMAMYLVDETESASWYVNYFSKIVKEIEAWADVS